MDYPFMDFTEKDIKRYEEKQHNLKLCLMDEIAFGDPSKTTLRKLEELRRIIDFDYYVKEYKKLKLASSYYLELLKDHDIRYSHNYQEMKEYLDYKRNDYEIGF